MSQLAIVKAFADLPDTRRTAGQRHHQGLWHRLVYLRCCCRKSWISGDWGLVESWARSISYFIWTTKRALTFLEHDSADITAVRISGLFWLLSEVFRNSTFKSIMSVMSLKEKMLVAFAPLDSFNIGQSHGILPLICIATLAFKTWLKLNVSLALVVAYSKIYSEWNSPGF